MTDDLIPWLRATLDEIEADARFYLDSGADAGGPGSEWARLVLAEVDAKRRILALHDSDHECSTIQRGTIDGKPYEDIDSFTWVLDGDCSTVRLLALPCADHPGYREEWRP